jgi:hypothetical protein
MANIVFQLRAISVTRHVNPWARAYFCAKLYRAALTVPTDQFEKHFPERNNKKLQEAKSQVLKKDRI